MDSEKTGTTADIKRDAADLYWLAFLLTGHQETSIELAADAAVCEHDTSPFFSDWMRSWRRRLVIGNALKAVRDDLADSARRTERTHVNARAVSWAGRSTKQVVTKDDLERALLEIDLFPRAALLLLVFEGMRIADAARLLDAEPALLKKAQAMGARQLAENLAGGAAPPVSGTARRRCSIWLVRKAVLC